MGGLLYASNTSKFWLWFTTFVFLLPSLCANQLGTLKTFQIHACDGSILEIKCPSNTSIDILHANYQAASRAENIPCIPSANTSTANCDYQPSSLKHKTTEKVMSSCHTKRRCHLEVQIATFSDEDFCPLAPKYLEVAYKCRPDTFVNKIVCEGDSLFIKCGRGSRIAIYSVMFGRSGKEQMQCPQPDGVPEDKCTASFATETAMKVCHGLNRCHINASTSFFGKPCPMRYTLFMKAVYTCVPLSVLKPLEVGASTAQQHDDLRSTTAAPPDAAPESNEKKGSKSLKEVDKGVMHSDATIPRRMSNEDLLNCTVTILSGTNNSEVGIITEWMRAMAFIHKNYEKIVLYLIIGGSVGALLCLVALCVHLLLQRRKERRKATLIKDHFAPSFTAVDETDIIGPSSLSDNYSPTPPNNHEQRAVRYYSGPQSGPRFNDTDLILPRSLSRENNQYLYN